MEVELRASVEVPILKLPSSAESNQCLALTPASVSVRAKYGVVLATCKDQFGVEVPTPILPPSSILKTEVPPSWKSAMAPVPV